MVQGAAAVREIAPGQGTANPIASPTGRDLDRRESMRAAMTDRQAIVSPTRRLRLVGRVHVAEPLASNGQTIRRPPGHPPGPPEASSPRGEGEPRASSRLTTRGVVLDDARRGTHRR